MKKFYEGCLVAFLTVVLIGGIMFGITYIAFNCIGPDYKQGEYTMVYKVYYSDNPKTYTIKNDWPIGVTSNRGTNIVKKTTHKSMFKKLYGTETVIETSAPIEVVSYTYKEK